MARVELTRRVLSHAQRLALSNSASRSNALRIASRSATHSASQVYANAGRNNESQLRSQGTVSTARDTTSEVHGGDDVHRVSKLVCDFSVTTNAIGPVPSAIVATKKLISATEESFTSPRGGDVSALTADDGDGIISSPAIEHYPIRVDAELTRKTAKFMRPDDEAAAKAVEENLIFGNGASELIDLVARAAPLGPYSVSPHSRVQYREYERACKNANRPFTEDPKEAAITCLVNPTNPTGDFLERAEMEAWIEANAAVGSWVIVDESMLFWGGSEWHKRGVSDEFVEKMLKQSVKIYRVYSWTKIFSCTGLRIGSTLCPTSRDRKYLESLQVPWSVNVMAREYLKAAVQDTEYMEKTYRCTKEWREYMVSRLKRLHPTWEFHGQDWLSWIWADTGDESVAQSVYESALSVGCPIRHAKAGYGLPTFLRFAVRRPSDFAVLYQALLLRESQMWKSASVQFGTYADVNSSVIEGVHLVHIDDLKAHEIVLSDRASKLEDYVKDLPTKILPALVVCSETQTVIDGHHRLDLFRKAGMNVVPAVFVNYHHEDILVAPPEVATQVTKETVIFNALQKKLLPPKSTQHMVRSRCGRLMPIIVLAPQIAEIKTAIA